MEGTIFIKTHFHESILGFVGLAITVLDSTRPGSTASVLGDFLAFLGAVAVIGYLLAGRNLRGWMPLFLYAFPV